MSIEKIIGTIEEIKQRLPSFTTFRFRPDDAAPMMCRTAEAERFQGKNPRIGYATIHKENGTNIVYQIDYEQTMGNSTAVIFGMFD